MQQLSPDQRIAAVGYAMSAASVPAEGIAAGAITLGNTTNSTPTAGTNVLVTLTNNELFSDWQGKLQLRQGEVGRLGVGLPKSWAMAVRHITTRKKSNASSIQPRNPARMALR